MGLCGGRKVVVAGVVVADAAADAEDGVVEEEEEVVDVDVRRACVWCAWTCCERGEAGL